MPSQLSRLTAALADRYAIERTLGAGGMATVYLARDLKHRRQVAIKVLRPELAAVLGADRFLKEIEVTAGLHHPHILPLHDSGEADGFLYYVMPYVEGESLRDLMDRVGRIPLSQALEMMRALGSALQYAHERGVVHRDIKPENILIQSGQAMIADFGIAVASDRAEGPRLTEAGISLGTPHYMSPEQVTGDRELDGRADIYALACVLHEMLAGEPPFAGRSAQSVIAKVMTAPPPDLPRDLDAGPGIDAALHAAMAKEPDDRFATMDAFVAALREAADTTARAGRRPWLAPAMAAVGVAAVLAVGAAFLRGGGSAGTGGAADGAETIAILPFEVAGADPALGQGMVSLLAANLDGVGPVRTIDARTVLYRWRAYDGDTRGVDLDGAMAIGRDVQARSVLIGSVVQAGPDVRIGAELYGVHGDEVARVRVDGAADDVMSLIDSLSLEILRVVWRSNEPVPSFDVTAVTSGSLDAVRAYMEGTLRYRQGRWDAAAAAFEEALAIDSTFALAYLALSEAYGWTGGHGSDEQAATAAAAHRFADRLPQRERLLVEAYYLYRQNDRAALDSILRYTERYPSDPRGWYALGDFQQHGMTDGILSPEQRLEPFDRAIALDSSMVAALVHPMEMSLVDGNEERFETYSRLNRAAGAGDRGLGVVARLAWGSPEDARSAIDAVFEHGGPSDIGVAVAVVHNPGIVPDILDAFEPLLAQASPAGMNMRYLVSQVALLIGDLSRVERIVATMESSGDDTERHLATLVRLAAVLGGAADRSYADAAIATVAEMEDESAEHYFRALLAATEGDATTARARLADVEIADANRRHRVRALGGWLSIMEGDTIQGVADLRAGLDSLPPANLGSPQIDNRYRLALARTLAARPETRDEGIRMLRYGFDIRTAPESDAMRLLALADALERAGDLEGAALALSDFIDRWQNAHPSLQPRVEAARRDLDRLLARRN